MVTIIHYRNECTHGHVHSQCECLGVVATVRVVPCWLPQCAVDTPVKPPERHAHGSEPYDPWSTRGLGPAHVLAYVWTNPETGVQHTLKPEDVEVVWESV